MLPVPNAANVGDDRITTVQGVSSTPIYETILDYPGSVSLSISDKTTLIF